MKKILTAVIVISLLAAGCLTIFAACAEGGDVDHTIYFYSSQGDALQTITDQAIAAFEAKYPGWTVEHSNPGGYDEVRDKIRQDFPAGTQPDLAYCYADHVAAYMSSNAQYLVDMSEFYTSDRNFSYTYTDGSGAEQTVNVEHIGFTEAETSKFVKGYIEEGYAKNYADYDKYGFSENSLLTLPFVKSTELMYVNRTALMACGIEEPAETWDQLWKDCEKIKAKYPSCTPLGYDSEANWFITMCQQNGWGYTSASGNHYLFNNDNTKVWLGQLAEYYDKGYITTQEDYDAYTSGLFVKGVSNEDGQNGLVYCIGSSGGASHQDPSGLFDFDIVPIPGSKQADGTTNYSCISQGPSLVMLTGGNNASNADEKKIMTWLFVKELLDPTFQAAFSIASGYNPMRTDVFDIETYQKHMAGGSATAKAAAIATELSDRFFASPAFDGSSNARDQVGIALLVAMTGSRDPSRALSEAISACGQ